MGRATRWLRSLLTGKKETGDAGGSAGRREKRRWSFGKAGKDVGAGGGAAPAAPAVWMRAAALYAETGDERSKRALAVAEATAAAAGAAVAAAHAAVAAARLTSRGPRGALFGGGELWAATRIQTVFRGFLARKALRALRALVKLQALVRGYLVRRQTLAALYGMQALVRAQVAARSQRIGHLRPRRSLERLDEVRSEYASFHSGRLSSSREHALGSLDGSPKIVEIDPGRPRVRNRRRSSPWCDAVVDAPPPRIATPDRRSGFRDSDWCLTGEECRFSTAQCTPRFSVLAGFPAAEGAAAAARRVPWSSPNYMTKTRSSEAKVRWQSAPKQRPEPAAAKRRSCSPTEAEESRPSPSGARMRRSCSQAQDAVRLKSAVASFKLGGEVAGDTSFHRRW